MEIFLKLFQMMDLEIADADGKYTAGFKQLSHLHPGSGVAARHRPVNQIKIQIIQLQPLHASVKSTIYISKALRIVPDLAGDKKFLTGYRIWRLPCLRFLHFCMRKQCR